MTPESYKIRYKNQHYGIMVIKYKGLKLPVIMDYGDFKVVNNLKKAWKCNKLGLISCSHTYNNETKDVFLHELIMAIKQKNNGKTRKNKPIIHLNRIGLDNRRNNLMYDTVNKKENKNIKKKKRTITIPKECGIEPEEIPTYVWYMKPNGSHGERFVVNIDDINWKTTSSKTLSLRYKLEEAKLFLRQLRKEKPELFQELSMNGDYTKKGKESSHELHTGQNDRRPANNY